MWELCVMCNRHKPLWEFNRNAKAKLGIQKYCRSCQKLDNTKYRESNAEHRRNYKHQYNIVHRESNSEHSRQYHLKNKKEINRRQQEYRKSNMDRDAYRSSRRRALKLNQTPNLCESELHRVRLLYNWANILGEDFQVDHIVPLSLGGLHHPDNMQIISRVQNLRKKDKHPKDFYGRHYNFIVKGEINEQR